jgi:uroporphyrinogen decarboxylase
MTHTPRTRFLSALAGGRPDRVPASPDLSNMVPCKLTGKPFWDIYLHNDPPLWKAQLDANRRLGVDPWFFRGSVEPILETTDTVSTRTVEKTDERIVVETTVRNAKGTITRSTAYLVADSPWPLSKPIKDPPRDIPVLLESMGTVTGCRTKNLQAMRAEITRDGVAEVALGFGGFRYPGFQYWINLFDGGLEQILDCHNERPDLLESLRQAEHERNLKILELTFDQDPDYVFLGASGTLTLGSPGLFRLYGLPTLKEITRRCKARGIPTLLHSCGRERELVRLCAEETELSCINPLEIAPMGDCDLRELKAAYGGRLSLMGNLHTTQVMLLGTKQQVMEAARKAIEDAGEGGGFILSTGDQCGRDTPLANIEALGEAAERYGRYPAE